LPFNFSLPILTTPLCLLFAVRFDSQITSSYWFLRTRHIFLSQYPNHYPILSIMSFEKNEDLLLTFPMPPTSGKQTHTK
jgi:hypothetical protein